MSTQALAVCPYLPKSEREDIVARIVAGKRLQRKLPFGGELRIERPLPFLVVVRVPPGTEQLAMHSFVSPQASYLIAPEDGRCRESYSELIGELASGLLPMFGSFLLIELWAGRDKAYNDQPSSPAFTIHARKNTPILATVNSLKDNLALISSQALSATVNVSFAKRVAPPGFKELLLTNRQAPKVRLVGVELSPSWVNALTGHRYELLRRSIVRQFSRALRRTLFQFTSSETTYVAEHYHSLGPRNLTKAVKRYDELIAEVGRSFDFLLQLSPINIEEAWAEFRRAKYAQQPQFRYRPINVDPGAAKAKLFSVAVEEIEDPTLARLYRAKRAELEQKLTTLANRNSKKAFYSNLLIYSEPSEELVALADRLLTAISPRTAEGKKADEVSASEMAKRARKEIAAYKKQYPEVPFQVELTSEIASTIMVSKKRLLIHKSATFPKRRVEALIQHEIGTHLVTALNGSEQPLRLLEVGLPGYDEFQEGCAVLAEYLVGGLTRARLRLLAGRVQACRALVDGADFIECFNMLTKVYGFPRRLAFGITTRVFRGGGITKDAVYLSGFLSVLKYVRAGHPLEELYVGKLSEKYAGLIRELRWRKVLGPATLVPPFLNQEEAKQRIIKLQQTSSIIELIKGTQK